ncbi:MAG: neutral/alkaline non-lysosomal ceramidase N-terminal domain-containing protein [Candidatus Solibacter usitatus]|nr:neutral/alkaline non-lysosomal ceramidase N-terminal domain-containing protein [Candidatus Solibacter usitatus]
MRVLTSFLLLAALGAAAPYRAGVARAVITPRKPIYLSGYANRTHPSEGQVHDLWAKALALEDRRGGRVVIVATDLIGLPRAIADAVAVRVLKDYNLERSRLLLNSSHTHTGPMIQGNLENLFELTGGERETIEEYSRGLIDDLVALVGKALEDLKPATLAFGNGTGGFAINRRENTAAGMRIGVNAKGPSDHDVPVVRITAPGGALRAVLFGYACHNTTLGGDFYRIAGDYAGFAQSRIEEAHPGSSALFLMLCGADQNPHPRGKLEQAEQHGASLAAEVERVLGAKLAPVKGPVRAAFRTVDLQFAPHTRGQFETLTGGANPFRARNARMQLRAYDQGRPIRQYSYPVQAISFGKDLTVVALGGEVVVDYALRVKREYGAKGIIVAGYSNDVMSYIPSLRVLKEGGYEAVDSMIYYGLPGPYNEEVEERVMRGVRDVMKRVKRDTTAGHRQRAAPK